MLLADGDAGLRLGEIIALEWRDIDLAARRLTVERSDWLGHVTAPKGGRSLAANDAAADGRTQGPSTPARRARVVLPDGSPITRDRVINTVRGAQRVAASSTECTTCGTRSVRTWR
jgi:integrase